MRARALRYNTGIVARLHRVGALRLPVDPLQSSGWSTLLLAAALAGFLLSTPIPEYGRALLGRSLAFPQSSQLVVVTETNRHGSFVGVQPLTAKRWSQDVASARMQARVQYRTGWLGSRHVVQAAVDRQFFDVLGVHAQHGSLFSASSSKDPSPVRKELVLSAAEARRLFTRVEAGIGAKVSWNGQPYQVTGVLPDNFHLGTRTPDVWATLQEDGLAANTLLVARLQPDASLAQLQREASQAVAWLAREEPATHRRHGAKAVPLWQWPLHDLFTPLLMLLIPFCAVNFLACAKAAEAVTNRARRVGLLRYLLFLYAKVLLLGSVLLALWLHGWYAAMPWLLDGLLLPVLLPVFMGTLFFTVCCLVARWCWRDQRLRCPICLRRLRMPVSTGSFSSMLMDRPGQDFICPHGHGRLFLPSQRPEDGGEPEWHASRGMWEELSSPNP